MYRLIRPLFILCVMCLVGFQLGCRKVRTGRQAPPDPKWTLKVGNVYSPLAMGQSGAVYLLTDAGELKAVGAGGGILWTSQVGGDKGSFGVAPAVSSDGSVYILTPHRLVLFGLNGTLLKDWTLKTNEGNALGIGLTNTHLYFQCAIYTVCSWSLGPLWEYQWSVDQLTGRAAPLIHRDGKVVLGGDPSVQLDGSSRVTDWFYPESGRLLPSRYDLRAVSLSGGSGNPTTAVAAGTEGRTYITSTSSRKLIALSDNGKLLWQKELLLLPLEPVVASDGTIYVATGGMKLVAFSPQGKELWTFKGLGQPGAPVLGASGTIYVPIGPKLYAFDPSGSEKWVATLDGNVWGSMTLNKDGTLYVATQAGTLYALPVGEGLMASPWPKFQGNVRNSGEEGVE